jgi:N-acetylglucosaminyldiphosphoundecaprenol N-acetyl-beta-D-mannosaminyltransferase
MSSVPSRLQRVPLLGEAVDLITPDEVMSFIDRSVKAGMPGLVVNHNFHSLYLIARTPGMRELYDMADLIEVDSAPLLFWGKLTGKPAEWRHRCTYLDWRERFWTLASQRGWRVFYLGGLPGVLETATRRLHALWPAVQIGGCSGYFDATPGSDDNVRVLAEIARFAPDVLLVGMGMPRQELWIAHHYAELGPCVVLPVGGAFDYESGVQKPAPRWMGRLGLEWTFRLAHAPTRLAARYLIEPWTLIPAAVDDLVRAYAPSHAVARPAPAQSSPYKAVKAKGAPASIADTFTPG